MVNGFYPVDHHPDMAQDCRAEINGGLGDAVDHSLSHEKPASVSAPAGFVFNHAAHDSRMIRGAFTPLIIQDCEPRQAEHCL